jgi:hypothetical protein
LRHIIGVLFQIAEPHVAILPINVADALHRDYLHPARWFVKRPC